MFHPPTTDALTIFAPPYRTLAPLELPGDLPDGRRLRRGVAVVWNLGAGDWGRTLRTVRDRPGGIALMAILPPSSDQEIATALLDVLGEARPHSILPHHPRPHVEDLKTVLRRPPADLPIEFTDYLAWRGIEVDRDTRHLLRKTVELSAELRTVTALARSVYLSRRALGRRFQTRGLPVPSHWLHFSRVLRATIRLQNTHENLFTVASGLGYPDGFSLSNQMHRLTGVRPSEARRHLGWEWMVEAWLRREAEDKRLALPPRPRASSRRVKGPVDRDGNSPSGSSTLDPGTNGVKIVS